MRAVVYAGPGRVRLDDVPPPRLEGDDDAVVKVSLGAICGSDLHLLEGRTPGAREGAVIGHEYVGTVADAGDAAARDLSEGDRVVGSFLIACGSCRECAAGRFNFCRSRRAIGLGTLTGDLDGAQAEYVRVPDAVLNTHHLPEDLDDERALFAGDILATGFYALSLGGVGSESVLVVIGAGPVGLCCALAATRVGPRRLLILDADPTRVAFAVDRLGLDGIDVSEVDAQAAVAGATGGDMADIVIEAVGAVPALKSGLKCVRDGGTVVVIGVYGAQRYELPLGMAWVRGIDIRFAGMSNVHAHWDDVIEAVHRREVDPTRLVTHRLSLDEAEEGYELFKSRRATKVLLIP